jgi:hypothetical protein
MAPNLPAFFIFRVLTAFQGTAFLIVGASCIGDMYRPVRQIFRYRKIKLTFPRPSALQL